MTPAALELSALDARRIALRAQSLLGARPAVPAGNRARQARIKAMVGHLGAVQLDTISVLARSHELIAYARLGPIGRPQIEAAYWGGDCFEYWGHAASIMPITQWPLFAFRRRHYCERRGIWSAQSAPPTADGIVDRLRAEGPLTATELGGAKTGSSWWGWSDVKVAVEFLLATGAVACVRRTGWRRVYDLPERVVPAHLLHDDLDDDACQAALVRASGQALGVATVADLADHFRLKRVDVERVLPASGLVPVSVDSWGSAAAWADPAAVSGPPARGQHVSTLLSPFDSLVWDRKRTLRVFDFDHRLEAYVPKNLREHGYFTMPILAGGRLIGRVDPAREGRTLIARQLSFEPLALRPTSVTATIAGAANALRAAADWVGCTDVALERVEPVGLVGPLTAALG